MNLAQVLINSLITAAELGIIAVGLTLTFALLRFPNFAHVEAAVAGGYIAWVFNVALGTNFALSTGIAVLVMGVVGILFDGAIFRAFRNMGDVAPMVASLGLAIAICYSVQAVFGPRFLRYDFAIAPGEKIFGAFITRQKIWIVGIVTLAMAAFHLLLQYTTIEGDARDLDQPGARPGERRRYRARDRLGVGSSAPALPRSAACSWPGTPSSCPTSASTW